MTDNTPVRTAQELERKYNLSGIEENSENISIQKTNINKVSNDLTNFVSQATTEFSDLQEQIDGNITTYFYSGVPTLSNLPASEWTTQDEKDRHLGDLYYDQDTGYAYRFYLSESVYGWLKITDTDVTEALAIANSAQDTADNKRRVFTSTPTTPYDNGDLWVKNEELYICQISKTESETYVETDFIIATKYTDDTKANEVDGELTVTKGRVSVVETGVSENSSTISEHTTTLDSQGNEIANNTTSISSITQTVDGITTEVSNLTSEQETQRTEIDQNTTDITALSSQIITVSATVSGVDTISLPNCNNGLLHYLKISNYYPSIIPFKIPKLINNLIILKVEDYLGNINYYNFDVGVLETGDYIEVIDGNVYVISNDKTYIDYIEIPLNGNSTITVENYDDVELKATYLLENDYTDVFASKVDTKSEIKISENEINLEVNSKIINYDDELTNKMVSKINLSNEGITINANKLNLNGLVTITNLEADYTDTNTLESNYTDTSTLESNYSSDTELKTSGSTTINGDNITTGSIKSSNYVVDTTGTKIDLTNGTIDTKNFKVDSTGDVSMAGDIFFTNGGKVVGGDGVLSNFQYASPVGHLGQWQYSLRGLAIAKGQLTLNIYISSDFTIDKAYVTVNIYKTENIYILSGGGSATNYGKVKNIKLYKGTTTSEWQYNPIFGTFTRPTTGITEISSAFGTSGYTSSTTEAASFTSTDIGSSLSSGENTLVVQTSDSALDNSVDSDVTLASQQHQIGFATLNIIGYFKQ